ncbi:MAG TPA: tetratricopeptide repeat protein [Pyrinomonadaceae bacterium]|nr:tetratricopeptide repeat protein [Pyrinomonadaceae bacterium]
MSETVVTLMQQADEARREKRLADAHAGLTEAVTLCRHAGVRAALVPALTRLGQIERDLGRGDAARALYEEAVAICRDEGNTLNLAHTVRHLGDIYQDAGHAELAKPCYVEALSLYRWDARTQPLDLANAIRPLAILKEGAGEFDLARRLWEEARDLYAAVNVSEGVAESSERIARLVSRQESVE